jgi:hypothetical protein
MKWSTLNPRERRTILGGSAILIVGLGWVYGLKPMRAALADLNDQIAIEREALAREQSAVQEATRSPARKRVADSAMAAVESKLFSGANDVAAGAELATYLGDVARRTHVWLSNASTQTARNSRSSTTAAAPATTLGRDDLRPIRVQLRAETDFRGMLDFLDALERGNKVVTVESLDIAKTLRAGDEERETLSISATVLAYALPRPAIPAPADSAPRKGGAQ